MKRLHYILIMAFFLGLFVSTLLVYGYTQITTGFLLNITNSSNLISYTMNENTDGNSIFNLTFTTNENKTFNVTIPQNSSVVDAKLNLSGILNTTQIYWNNTNLDWSVWGNTTPAQNTRWTAIEFIPDNSGRLVNISVNVSNENSPTSGLLLYFVIANGTDDSKLVGATNLANTDLGTISGWGWRNFTLSSPVYIENGTTYAIILNTSSFQPNDYLWGRKTDSPCTTNKKWFSLDAGVTWEQSLIPLDCLAYKITYDIQPSNPYLDVSGDGDLEWEFLGDFNQTNNQTSDFSSEINDFLSTCSADSNGNCNLSVILHSDTAGKIEVKLNITYDYNISNLFTSQFSSQYQEAGVEVNHTTIVNYTSQNISNNISISGIYLNYSGDAPTSCKINNTTGTVDSTLKSCNLTMNLYRGDKFGNYTIFYSKGNKITKTDKGSVKDINSTILFANSSGWNYNTTWYYWNVTLELNDTDTINYTNVLWNNYLTGANFSYAQNISNGTIAQLNYTSKLNVISRFRTGVVNVTETVSKQTGTEYENDITLTAPSDLDTGFRDSYYKSIYVNATLNSSYTSFNLYWWNGNAWELHTSTAFYNFTVASNNESATFYANMSSVQYFSISSTTPTYTPPTTSRDGGGGGVIVTIRTIGNWSLQKDSAFIWMTSNSSITQWMTVENKQSDKLTEVSITCPEESDPYNLCQYVTFEKVALSGGVPMFQTFSVAPGQTADISYTITLPLKPDLNPFNTYAFTLMIEIANEKRPFTINIFYTPGCDGCGEVITIISGSSFGIPHWLLIVIGIILLIIMLIFAYSRLTRKKWYNLKKIKYF